MKRLIAVGLIGFAVMAGGIIGTSASAAPKAKPAVTTEAPEPTVTRTVKPEYTIPPCLVDGEPEAC